MQGAFSHADDRVRSMAWQVMLHGTRHAGVGRSLRASAEVSNAAGLHVRDLRNAYVRDQILPDYRVHLDLQGK